MINLISTEWLKMRNYRAFWWIMGLIVLAYPGLTYIFYLVFQDMSKQEDMMSKMASMLLGDPFKFPELWHTVAYTSSMLMIAPAIMVIMFISNEYEARTHRQNIIDGWTRNQFMTAKMIDVLLVSLITTVMATLTAIGTGLAATGSISFEGASYMGWFFLLVFAQLSIAFFLSFLIRRSFIAVGIFMFYGILLEEALAKLLTFKAKSDLGRCLPFESSDLLVIPPSFTGALHPEQYKNYQNWHTGQIFVTLAYLVVIWGICYWVNSKKDLKS